MKIPFKQVDVFTNIPFGGNPVAVILDGQELDTAQMQRIANWTNLSESTFVLPPTQPQADYRVRIFTPRAEMPFAGHPTLGTAHALLEAGIVKPKDGKLVQECGAGLIPLVIGENSDGKREIAFDLPSPSFTALEAGQISQLENILGVRSVSVETPRQVNVGPVWTVVQLGNADEVLELRPDMAGLTEFDQRIGSVGVVVFGPHQNKGTAALEVRAFAPSCGVNEDPVCGSGNGAVAAFIRESGQIQSFGRRYVSSQGKMVGREGKLSIAIDESGAIRVGGHSITCIDGTIAI